MNKCGVMFPCNGIWQCEFYLRGNPEDVRCFHAKEGLCTNKEAQIKALQDEGFEICDRGCKQDMGREE
jgi:hypothetical protein